MFGFFKSKKKDPPTRRFLFDSCNDDSWTLKVNRFENIPKNPVFMASDLKPKPKVEQWFENPLVQGGGDSGVHIHLHFQFNAPVGNINISDFLSAASNLTPEPTRLKSFDPPPTENLYHFICKHCGNNAFEDRMPSFCRRCEHKWTFYRYYGGAMY